MKPTKKTPKRTSYEDVCKRLGVKPKNVKTVIHPPKYASPDFTKTHTAGRYGTKPERHAVDALLLDKSGRKKALAKR